MNTQTIVAPSPLCADAGTAWFSRTSIADRTPLLVALVSRFNHDLRTPLNTISGWTHLLQQTAVDAARTRHVSEVFARNVREETLLLEEFVDDARVLLGALVLEQREVSIGELASAAAERLAPALDIHEVKLDALPSDDLDARLTVDRARISRLLYRLLLAAVRRTPEGGTVIQRLATTAKQVMVDIEAPTSKPSFENGSLLDLRIASAIAELAGGTLDIAVPDRHSHFRLKLPRA
jgi:signal transduction histidine kinase